jgi:hypothetical protein
MVHRDKKGIFYMAMYVDNIYANGNDLALAGTVIGLKKCFKTKVVDDPTDYLSCEI